MRLFDPDPNLRWLFCMTHPDDELSIAGWIARLVRSGAEVHLSWTTSTPERRWEAREAARFLGVSMERLHFLPGRDRGVETQLAELAPIFGELIGGLAPDRIVAGAFEQGHLDHDATNFLVTRALNSQDSKGVFLETPFYHAYCRPIPVLNRFADPGDEERLPLDPDEVQLKLAMARCYPSQNIWGNLLLYRFLQRINGDAEPVGSVERLRCHCGNDFRAPRLPEPLAAQVRRTSRWRRWLSALDSFESTQ